MKPTGILYSEVYHPGFINLETKKWFTFKYKSQLISIAVDRHVDALHAINLKNKLITGGPENELYTQTEKGLNVEYQAGVLNTKKKVLINYSEGQILYTNYITVFVVAYETTKSEKSCINDELYQEVIEFFIRKYRAISRDYFIQLPAGLQSERYYTGRAFYEYTKKDYKLSVYSRLIANRKLTLSLGMFKFHNLVESLPSLSNEQIKQLSVDFEKILHDESSLNQLDFQEHLVQIAREINIYKNFKHSLLESFIYCEQLISSSLREMKLKNGVSKKKLDDYEKEVSISYQINVELPVMLQNLDKTGRDTLGRVDRVRRIRNGVVHNNISVDEKDAMFSLLALEDLYKLLTTNQVL